MERDRRGKKIGDGMDRITTAGGLQYLTSKKLLCPNGFSTRIGGVSKADLLDTLNLTISGRGGETKENVLENLRRFSEAIGVSKESMYAVPQCNGHNIAHVRQEDAGTGYYHSVGVAYFVGGRECYDGYITRDRNVTIGIKTTDCLPILFSHVADGVVDVVASAHVGCRDDFKHPTCNVVTIVPKVLQEMNCDIRQVRAALGPCGAECCAKVSDTVVSMIESDFGIAETAKYCRKAESGFWYIDMRGMNRKLLLELGVLEENMDTTDLCTCCHKKLFFSHIRDGRQTGSMLAAIALPNH